MGKTMFEISGALWGLLITTFVVAATHTVSPDHWFGFVMLGRAKKWGLGKTLTVASIAGVGHVGTSVILGLIGVWAGAELAENYASVVEAATGWALVVFGFGFAIYSWLKGGHGHTHGGNPLINRLLRVDTYEAQEMMHGHDHGDHGHSHHDDDHDDDDHDHGHGHYDDDDDDDHEHDHHDDHGKKKKKKIEAGYGLVAIIGLTPCVLLIPLAFRAGEMGMPAVVWTMIVFFVATMAAILLLVALALKGLQLIKFDFFEKYGEVITGVIIGIMGILVVAGFI